MRICIADSRRVSASACFGKRGVTEPDQQLYEKKRKREYGNNIRHQINMTDHNKNESSEMTRIIGIMCM